MKKEFISWRFADWIIEYEHYPFAILFWWLLILRSLSIKVKE